MMPLHLAAVVPTPARPPPSASAGPARRTAGSALKAWTRDRRILLLWTCRGLAVVLVLGQLIVIHSQVPLGDRQFISPDDGDALRYSRAIADHGLPVLSGRDIWPTGSEGDPLFVPGGSVAIRSDTYVTVRAPGLFFVLAPFSAGGQTGIMVGAEIVFVLSEAAIYMFLDRKFGPAAAVLGLAAFAFHPSVLFWSWFPRSNLAAIGLLAGGLLLLDDARLKRNVVGIAVVIVSGLFRWEFLPLGGLVLLGWAISRLRRGGPDLGYRTASAATAAAVAYVVVVGFVWLVYRTFDPNTILGRGGEVAAAEGGASLGTFALLGQHFGEFGFLLLLPFVQLLGFAVRRPDGATAGLGLAAVGMYAYLLMSQGASQPVFFLQSMTRYLFPIALAAAIALAGLLAGRRVPSHALVAAALLLASLGSVLLVSGPDASGGLVDYMATEAPLVEAADSLPGDAVFLGFFSANALPGRYAIRPDAIADPAESRPATVDAVHRLLEADHPVYGTFLRPDPYRGWIDQDPRLTSTVIIPGVLWQAHLEAEA
jgi:hypothetical protein